MSSTVETERNYAVQRMKPKGVWSEKRTWDTFRQFILLRDGNRCQRCGKLQEIGLHIHHHFGRRCQALRYSEKNCCALDFSCHNFFHENPFEHVEWMRKRVGEREYEQLIVAKRESVPKWIAIQNAQAWLGEWAKSQGLK